MLGFEANIIIYHKEVTGRVRVILCGVNWENNVLNVIRTCLNIKGKFVHTLCSCVLKWFVLELVSRSMCNQMDLCKSHIHNCFFKVIITLLANHLSGVLTWVRTTIVIKSGNKSCGAWAGVYMTKSLVIARSVRSHLPHEIMEVCQRKDGSGHL